jgi:trans-aconitate 2-methyltransferase
MTEGAKTGGAAKEWNAAAYHVLSEPQYAWGLRVLERASPRAGERVLDAGCGSGRLTKELVAKVQHGFVVACDLSENMTRAAAVTLGKSRASAVLCADLSALPFRAAFDLIFSTATFHWIRDHDQLFSQLRSSLRNGGRLEAQCGGGPNLASIHARADSLTSQSPFGDRFAGWEDPWLFASPEETGVRLRRAGFTAATCWLERAPTTFPDAQSYRAFIESVVMRPYLARLSEAELRTRFLDALVAQAVDDDPPYTLDYWRLNLSATTN